MSEDGGATKPRRKRPWISTLLVMALTVGLGATGGFVFKHDDGGPRYPKAWDPRIAPLADIAAKDRGLTFKHPVFVEFLSDAAFNQTVTTKDKDLSTSDKKKIQLQAAELRTLGFISGGVDLLDQSNQLNAAGILAFYSPEDKKIRIRGTTLTPAIKVTLVHELTHVLQDQYFDLIGTEKRLEKTGGSEGSWAFHALVEGDARRIEHEYRDSLPQAEQDQISKDEDAAAKAAEKEAKDVAGFLIADGQAPYDLGEIAIKRVARDGNKAVDALFKNPPAHDAQLVRPWVLGSPWTDIPFTSPTLPKGATKNDTSEFGAFYLYLMLAETMPVQQALTASDGWGGGQILTYTKNGAVCSALAITGQNADSTTAIFNGLKAWATDMPNEPKATQNGATVQVTSCDPSSAFNTPGWTSLAAEEMLAARNAIEVDMEQDISTNRSVCYANGVVQHFGADVLQFTDAQHLTDAQRTTMRQIARDCYHTS